MATLKRMFGLKSKRCGFLKRKRVNCLPWTNELFPGILAIYLKSELDESSVVLNFRIAAADGKRYNTNHYNFDVIISVG
jgi:hypothetical protein